MALCLCCDRLASMLVLTGRCASTSNRCGGTVIVIITVATSVMHVVRIYKRTSDVLIVLQDVVPEDQMKEEIMDSIQKGNFTMRILKDQLQNILKMGPVGQVMGMIPGFNNAMMPKVLAASFLLSFMPALVLFCLSCGVSGKDARFFLCQHRHYCMVELQLGRQVTCPDVAEYTNAITVNSDLLYY